MSYFCIYALTQRFYFGSAPVCVNGGALLREEQSGRCSAALELENLTQEKISEVALQIIPANGAGQKLPAVLYRYTQVSAPGGKTFGRQTAIPMPPEAASFTVGLQEVQTESGRVWSAYGKNWTAPAPAEPDPAPTPAAAPPAASRGQLPVSMLLTVLSMGMMTLSCIAAICNAADSDSFFNPYSALYWVAELLRSCILALFLPLLCEISMRSKACCLRPEKLSYVCYIVAGLQIFAAVIGEIYLATGHNTRSSANVLTGLFIIMNHVFGSATQTLSSFLSLFQNGALRMKRQELVVVLLDFTVFAAGGLLIAKNIAAGRLVSRREK